MAQYYLGVDIGGTNIKAVMLNGRGTVSRCFVIATSTRKARFFKNLRLFVQKITSDKKITGIGVGVPGIVDARRGVLVKAPNLPFLNGWRVKYFFQRFTHRVLVDNDSRCFLRAEVEAGAARGERNVVGITIGTGIGGGILIDGKMYRGSRGGAGEFGHMMIRVRSQKRIKDKNYEWEELAAKKAFLEHGDRSEMIGIGVANLINAFDPDMVVLGGGGVMGGGVRLEEVRRIARTYTLSPLGKKIPIVKGKLGDRAQAIGAALLCKRFR